MLSKAGVLLVSAIFVAHSGWAQSPTSQAPKRHSKRAAQKPAPAPASAAPNPAQAPSQPVPSAPAKPLTPSQLMPGPPNVSYAGGQLTVVANNSTLQDVINAIHTATGTNFIVNGGSTQDRLFGRYGPGSPNLVLAQILKGTRLSYILVSDPNRPDQVQTATLLPASAPIASANANQAPGQRNPNFGQQQEVQNENDEGDEAQEVPQPPPPQQFPGQINGQVPSGQAPAVQPQPAVPQTNAAVNPDANQQNAQQNGPKTPEQLLQELQRLQQIRIQQIQQQQQNPQSQNPPQQYQPQNPQ